MEANFSRSSSGTRGGARLVENPRVELQPGELPDQEEGARPPGLLHERPPSRKQTLRPKTSVRTSARAMPPAAPTCRPARWSAGRARRRASRCGSSAPSACGRDRARRRPEGSRRASSRRSRARRSRGPCEWATGSTAVVAHDVRDHRDVLAVEAEDLGARDQVLPVLVMPASLPRTSRCRGGARPRGGAPGERGPARARPAGRRTGAARAAQRAAHAARRSGTCGRG